VINEKFSLLAFRKKLLQTFEKFYDDGSGRYKLFYRFFAVFEKTVWASRCFLVTEIPIQLATVWDDNGDRKELEGEDPFWTFQKMVFERRSLIQVIQLEIIQKEKTIRIPEIQIFPVVGSKKISDMVSLLLKEARRPDLDLNSSTI